MCYIYDMKQNHFGLPPLLIGFFLLWVPSLSAQEEEPPVIREEVSVVNVEVPVRVFQDGRQVSGLQRSDFLLSEGGVPQKINGFFVDRRSLVPRSGETSPVGPLRHFSVIFRLTQIGEGVKDGIRSLARNVLRKGDQIDVWINDRALLSHVFTAAGDFEKWIMDGLGPFVLEARNEQDSMVRKIETSIQQYRFRKMQGEVTAAETLLFLEEYLKSFRHYKQQYIVPDLAMYYRYAARLQRIRRSKWVLSFYQYHLFPKLKISGPLLQEIEMLARALNVGRSEDAAYARMINALLQQMHTEFNVADSLPSEAIAKIFYKVNASFHAVFMPTFQDTLLEDIELKAINSDLENSMRQLIKLTGGSLQNTSNIANALENISSSEDILYLLTYAPANPEDRGKISVSLPGHPYSVRYDDQMRADYLKDFIAREEKREQGLIIDNLRLENQAILFTIKGFLANESRSGTPGGTVRVRLRISDCGLNILLEQEASMKTVKKEVSISIPLRISLPECSNIVVEAEDLLSGTTTQSWIKTEASR